MAMVNFHSARVRDPDEFKEDAMAIGDKFATMQLSPGVSMLIGIPKGKTTTDAQSYRFAADIFSPHLAKDWLKKHEVDYLDFEEATQENPKFKKKKSSPREHGISYRGMETELIPYDTLALKHGIPLSRIYEAHIPRTSEWHHVRKYIKGERTGSLIEVEFGTEEDFLSDVEAGLFKKEKKEKPWWHGLSPEEAERIAKEQHEEIEKAKKTERPKTKKNPRPPLWSDKTYIATQGIGGLIYFGYKDPPTEFKTKKARREYGRRLYNKYRAFLKKFNLKADETLSGQRKAAYEHGGTKKLKARAKRTSTLLNPKAASGRDKKNPSKAQPKSQSTPEIAAARAYKYFTDGRNPTKTLKVRRPRKRTVFIELARGVDITHSDDQYEYAYRLGGKKINWDLENNAIIIFVPELDKILGNDVKKPHDSPVSFNRRDRNAAEKIFRTFQGKKPKKLEYRTMENKSLCVEINKALAIRYRSDKYGGSPNQLYKHPFGDAIMYCDIGNSAIVIMGHNLEITKAGIEG